MDTPLQHASPSDQNLDVGLAWEDTTLVPCSSVHVVEVWYWIVCHLWENWRVGYSYPCFHMCMQKYYYIYQSTEGRKEKFTALLANNYACFESSSVICTYRIDKSYKHNHYQLVSSSAGQRRDKMEIHPPPHQGACPTRRDMVHVAMATSLCGLFLSPQSLWVKQYLHWDCGNS